MTPRGKRWVLASAMCLLFFGLIALSIWSWKELELSVPAPINQTVAELRERLDGIGNSVKAAIVSSSEPIQNSKGLFGWMNNTIRYNLTDDFIRLYNAAAAAADTAGPQAHEFANFSAVFVQGVSQYYPRLQRRQHRSAAATVHARACALCTERQRAVGAARGTHGA